MRKPADDRTDDASASDPSLLRDDASGREEREIALDVFHLVERVLLFVIVLMTVVAVAFEAVSVFEAREVLLADILLMFLYLEVIGMIAVYYARRESVFVYPIFIAITAVTRLVVLQGKEMEPGNILIEALAILFLALAALVVVRVGRK